ncbi:PREDICTED: uncharacterized protein LOC109114370 [Nelumbo nucifera]|uniref:Uncharacterized protein LOC109114370 n=1 Tax=Nelumbo nucifera TaxID=4432 RepID=A0A1U8Q1D3_NELNU|nr:PREDICTED: uncharacterized protein LOC109114370 [Nelumbo nucifera]
MEEEFNALLSSGTWEHWQAPPHSNVIGCKWVFRIKRNPDVSIARYESLLVAKGYSQRGVDLKETLSPVIKPATLCTILSLAISHNRPLCQLDDQNAFLHGTLDEHVYIIGENGVTVTLEEKL